MAYIDHTRLVWKNGKYIGDGVKLAENGYDIVHLCPFEYGRDGNIMSVENSSGVMVDISDSIEWCQCEYDTLYQRKGIEWRTPWRCRSISDFFYALRSRLNWLFRQMELLAYRERVGVWTCDDTEVYIYHDVLKSSYVSFYRNGLDTYIMLGGYGRHENVYTHFAGRGYGEDFEEAMAKEAYRWCCDDILTKVADLAFGDRWDDCGKFTELREKFYMEENK